MSVIRYRQFSNIRYAQSKLIVICRVSSHLLGPKKNWVVRGKNWMGNKMVFRLKLLLLLFLACTRRLSIVIVRNIYWTIMTTLQRERATRTKKLGFHQFLLFDNVKEIIYWCDEYRLLTFPEHGNFHFFVVVFNRRLLKKNTATLPIFEHAKDKIVH